VARFIDRAEEHGGISLRVVENTGAAGDVILLPENAAPGEPVRMAFRLQAPSKPGDYEVEMRVTQAIDKQSGILGLAVLHRNVSVR